MLYVKSIESNLRRGCKLDIGSKTLLLGPNSSGKSSIINAVELALTGKVSDVAGRSVMAKASDLVSHLSSDKSLFSVATLSDDSTCSWRTGIKGKKSAEHDLPSALEKRLDALFPVRNIHDALLGEAATTRRFFLKLAVGSVSDADVLSRIPTPLQAYFRSAILKAVGVTSPLDRLLFALEHAKEEAAKATAKYKILKESLTNMTSGLPAAITEAEVVGIKKELDKKRNEVETGASINSRWELSQNIDDRLIALEDAFIEAKTKAWNLDREVKALEEKLAAIPSNPTHEPHKQAIINCIRWHDDHQFDECQVCGTHAGKRNIKSRRQELETLLSEFQVEEARRVELTKELNSTRYLLTTQQNRMHSIELEGKQLASLSPDEIKPVDVDALRTEIKELEARYLGLVESKAKWESSTRSRDAAVTAENDANQWKQLTGACNDAIASLLETGVSTFSAKVSAYLPEGEDFGLLLHEGSRGMCRVGLVREKRLHTALSGAEWSRALGALALTCVEIDKPPLAVVVPPVGEFDAETLSSVLESYEDAEAQVIIATPTRPARVGSAWTVIELGGEVAPQFVTGLQVAGAYDARIFRNEAS